MFVCSREKSFKNAYLRVLKYWPCVFTGKLTTVKRVTMDDEICGVSMCVWNAAISKEVFNTIGEGKDRHAEKWVDVGTSFKIYKPPALDKCRLAGGGADHQGKPCIDSMQSPFLT